MYVLYDAGKHIMMQLTESRLIWKHDTMSCFVTEDTIEGVLVCDVTSKVTEIMVPKLTTHFAEKIVEQQKQTLILLQMTLFFDSGHETRIYDSLKHS